MPINAKIDSQPTTKGPTTFTPLQAPLLPLAVSCFGWAVLLILVNMSKSSTDLEGAYAFGALAGMASFALTPLSVAFVLRKTMRHVSLTWYLVLLVVVSLPALSFQVFAFSASFMPGFFGSWIYQGPPSISVYAWLALPAILLYSGISLAAYVFVARFRPDHRHNA